MEEMMTDNDEELALARAKIFAHAKAIGLGLVSHTAETNQPSQHLTHDVYKNGDWDAPDSIKDRNGDVVLSLCRRCGRGEIELIEPCNSKKTRQPVRSKRRSGWSRSDRSFKNFQDKPVVATVKAAMNEHDSIERAAKAISLDAACFSFIHKLIVLKERGLPPGDMEAIDKALVLVETQKQTQSARKIADGIVDKYWKETMKRQEEKQSHVKRRFDAALVHIRESCESTTDMRIPVFMSQREVQRSIATLSSSLETIARLIRRLNGESHDDKE